MPSSALGRFLHGMAFSTASKVSVVSLVKAIEEFLGDEEANAMLGRTQREPYTIEA